LDRQQLLVKIETALGGKPDPDVLDGVSDFVLGIVYGFITSGDLVLVDGRITSNQRILDAGLAASSFNRISEELNNEN
jgi:hypothetical protein